MENSRETKNEIEIAAKSSDVPVHVHVVPTAVASHNRFHGAISKSGTQTGCKAISFTNSLLT